jgi:hypothetical protein
MDGKSHFTGNSLYGEMIHMHRPDAQMPAIPDLDLRRTLLGIWRFVLPLYVGFPEAKPTPRFGNTISSLNRKSSASLLGTLERVSSSFIFVRASYLR